MALPSWIVCRSALSFVPETVPKQNSTPRLIYNMPFRHFVTKQFPLRAQRLNDLCI